MTREIRINLIAKDDVSGRLQVISAEAEKTSGSLQKAGSEGAKGMDEVSKAAERTTESLDRSAVAAGAFGGAILSALVVPIGMGTKAAWDQVDAVEQATLALRAYETDARKVEAALADMLAFARSDAGRLFMRQELFAFAQQLRVAGVETENLARYTEIASRSVATGMGNWDELARVITRVGQTSRLTSIDFEMLQKMGFQLDQDLRNQTVTWEELFDVLDQGSVTVEGATNTIQGQMMMLRTELRGLGLDFLQVNSETSEFAEGGLGSVLYNSLSRTREVLSSIRPIARGAGEALAFLAGGAALAVDGFLGLPQGIQTTVFALVGGTGAIISGASLLLLTINKLTAGVGALRAVFTGLAAHPVGLALTALAVVIGIGVSAWARHRNEVQKAQEAYDRVGQTALEVQDIINNFKLDGGDLGLAAQISEINSFTAATLESIQMVNEQRFDWTAILGIAYTDGTCAAGDSVRKFLDSGVGRAFIKWAEDNERLGPDIVKILMEGTGPELFQVMAELQPLMDEFFSLFDVPPDMHARVSENTAQLIDYMMKPLVDSEQVMADWAEARDKFFSDPLAPDVEGYDAWLESYLADLPDVTAKANEATEAIDGMTEAQRKFNLEIAQMRLDGQSELADDLVRLDKLILDIGEDFEATNDYVDFLFSNVRSGKISLSEIEGELGRIRDMREKGKITEEEYNELLIEVIMNQVLVTETANQQADAFRNIGQELGITNGYLEDYQDWLDRVADNMEHLIDVVGFGDPLSRWNIEGNATALSTLAMNANHAASALDSIFRVVVGNTNAIGSQFDQIFKWAEDLIAEEGVWSKLDDLLVSGRISGEHGVFNDGSEYALAQQAYNTILEKNVRLQESLLTIQAKQAPLIAEQASAYEDLIYEISMLPAQQQMVTLGWMDQASAAKAIELQTLAVAAANGELGKSGQQMFSQVIAGAVAADPVLKAMLLDMGLISEGADGTITVNYDDVVDGKSEIAELTDAIYLLIEALTGVPVNVTTTVDVVDNATSPIQNIINMINSLPDRRTTVVQTVLETVERYVGPTPYAHGGMIREYATGGVLFRAAEYNRPEIAHFATGGTALLPRDGLYNAPAGTYISPNNAISNHYGGGITIDFSGAVFHNTSRAEMNAWAQEDFIPGIQSALGDRRVGMGASS